MKLIDALNYKPAELSFGTSGLRGLLSDMTDLECFINITGFLEFLEKKDRLRKGENLYIGGDLRESTPHIMSVVVRACETYGVIPLNCGFIPTPALAYYATSKHKPCIMVTGSHIPDDRNGIKFYKRGGEVLRSTKLLYKLRLLMYVRLYTEKTPTPQCLQAPVL
jgi:phosphomannomutase